MANEELREKYCKIFAGAIKRKGADKLLEWLKGTDFFTAPASTRFHGAHEGGLVEHSLNVYARLWQIVAANASRFQMLPEQLEEAVAICALLHDVCKANFYVVEMRNRKDENGQWVQVPYYTVDDQMPYGHGEQSVYTIEHFMRLSQEEAMAIRWHMGGFDDAVKGGSYSAGNAFGKYPLAVMLHMADLLATYLDEAEDEK